MSDNTQVSHKIIISLFDYSGVWSYFYRLAGYIVLQIDSKLGIDFYDFIYKSIDKSRVHGIIATPPCVDFTKAGANLWKRKDTTGVTKKSLKLILDVLELIDYFNPSFWVLENPPGRLETLIPDLTKLRLLSYQPYDYGAPYSKYTILYGNFNPFLIQTPVKPITPNAKGQMSIDNYHIHYQSKTVPRNKRSEFRSITPIEFALAFYNANP